MLFVAFSPANRLSKFCSQKRIKDMLQHYIELPVERRLTIENLELQIKKSTLESQILDANIRSFDSVSQMELEKQEKMDVDLVAQQTTPHQFDTNNWTNPYISNIQESILQDWMNEGKGIANSSGNYAYSPSFPSSSQNGNITFFQSQNSSPYIPLQNQQQNIMIDVHENPTQTFGQLQSQEQNMMVDFQQNPTQIFGQSQAQMTCGESNDNSLFNFWQNICDSTRPVSCTQLNNTFQLGLENDNTTWNNNLNNASSFGWENAHSNWNNNMSNNNNYINEYNDPPSVQSDAITPNVNGFNYSMEENTTRNIAQCTTHENDACEWEVFLNEAFNGEDYKNLD
ncbi:rho GTPase-activating protein gacU-like [Solanum pennellii]|uniref:Rho GTPase-activating protein gacU-like n=1 Tax=Solanum pennellii TaxID=28526 RepID=A0ABM1VEG3_SOLPN|nr:rho GTPase-activating protein gacU-like [Solanum pennellii]